jgi:hypothetical protein
MIRSFQKAEKAQTGVFPEPPWVRSAHVRAIAARAMALFAFAGSPGALDSSAGAGGFVRRKAAFGVASRCTEVRPVARERAGAGAMGSFSSCDEPLSAGRTRSHCRFAPRQSSLASFGAPDG